MRQEERIKSNDTVAQGATGGDLLAARVIARALAQAAPERERIVLARAFSYRVISIWWSIVTSTARDFPLRPLFELTELGALPEPAIAAADSIGRSASSLEPESAAYIIGLTYTSMLPEGFRAEHGVYYTPPELTARLLDQAEAAGIDWKTCRVLDPACGGGAFLAPAARRMIDALPNVTPAVLLKNIATRLRGFEIDPFAAWLSQVALDAVTLPVCQKAHRSLPIQVIVCDSLKRRLPRDRYDLVVGNPPYGRVKLSSDDRHCFRRSLFGHANLYGLFTDIALRHTKQDGVIAYVTPTSFLAGEYFKNLRALMGREAPPVTVDLVAIRKGVFEDVLQETALATYRRGRRGKRGEAFEILPRSDRSGGLQIARTGSFCLPSDPSEPWLLPRSHKQAALVHKLQMMAHRLADWGYGVSTGPLVWNRHKAQLRSRSKAGRYPLLWAEAVTSDGQFLFRALKKNHEPYFEPHVGDEWLVTRNPCVLLQRTTAKEQNRRLIAAALPSSFLEEHGAVVIENHLNMVRPIVDEPAISPETLAAFLNSAAADRAFRCVSGSVAVSAYELEALPLPAPDDLGDLQHLVREGASRQDIEAACHRLYHETD